jgi:hypothetical protein
MLFRLDAVSQRSKSLERNESYYSASSSSFATGTEEEEMWSGGRNKYRTSCDQGAQSLHRPSTSKILDVARSEVFYDLID